MVALDPLYITALSLGFLSFATVVGNPIRRLFLSPEVFEGPRPNLPIRWVTSVMTGVAVIPLVFTAAGLFSGWAGPGLALGLLLGTSAWNVAIYVKEIRHLGTKLVRLRESFDRDDQIFVLLFLVILSFHLSPLLGLWTTPGDDAKLYSLITQRFIETAGTPQTWGIYAEPSWYMERTHLLLPGFSSVVASVVYLFGTEIPATVSVVTALFRVLPVATLFVFAFTLIQRKLPAILTAGAYGLIVIEPIFAWFQWGGNAELSALSLLPLTAAGTYVLYSGRSSSPRLIVWLGVLLGGMTLLHPFAFFYFVAFAVPLSLLVLWERRWNRLGRIWLPVGFGLLLAAPPIVGAFRAEASITGEYSAYNPAWTPLASWSMTPSTIAANVLSRVTNVYGPAIVALLFVAVLLSRTRFREEKKVLVILGFWVAGIFFLHENNPNGLWLLRFPLWYRIDANRTFDVTSFVAATVAGLVLEHAIHRTLPASTASPTYSVVEHLRSIVANRRKLIAVSALLIILTGQLFANASTIYESRALSPITSDDIVSFGWIRMHTPDTATFFVNWADAGTWIPDFANRRVVMPFGVVTNYPLLDAYTQALTNFASNATNARSIRFMLNLSVTYVYASSARIYGRQGFDPVRIAASGLFDIAYHGNSVWIFSLNQTKVSVLGLDASIATKSAGCTDTGS